MRGLILSLFGVVVIAFSSCVTAGGYPSLEDVRRSDGLTDAQLNELTLSVNELETRFNVLQREDHSLYFQLADELTRRGQDREALAYYETGLRISALDLEAQVRAAELEILLGDPTSAYERLTFAVARAEEGPLRRYALQLIEDNDLAQSYQLTEIPDRPDLVLRIQPIGDVAPRILYAVSARIEEEFRVSIDLLPAIEMPASITVRESLTRRANRAIEDIEEHNPREVLREFYAAVGVAGESPSTVEEKHAVLRALVLQQEDGRRIWEQLVQANFVQYNASDLLSFLTTTGDTSELAGTNIGELAITDADLYRNDLNFLFALTQRGVSVMSTARLFDPERDSIDEGIHRAVVQAMTSYVQLLGVPRASKMPCATAYPNSLQEFDQKNDRLCEETRVGVVAVYADL